MAIEVMDKFDDQAIEDMATWVAKQDFERVLDVGGHEYPLRCATHVIDLLPYTDIGNHHGRGPLPVRHVEQNWMVRDACATPWPFMPNSFDFVWCSQVLEDIRDPVRVCQEMQRVAKAGFISTVHRYYESTVVQFDGAVGYHHHRWLIEADPFLNEVTFTYKSPKLHVDRAYRPRPNGLPDDPRLLHIEWRDRFRARERFTGGHQAQESELLAYQRRWALGGMLT